MPLMLISEGSRSKSGTLIGVSMRSHILSMANVLALPRGNSRSAKAPSRSVSIRTPFEPIEGGSVLDGIHPGRRCHLNLGLPWRVVAIHQGIRSRLRTVSVGRLAKSIARLYRLTCWSYRYSWRREHPQAAAWPLEAVMNSIRNGLGMRKAGDRGGAGQPENPHSNAVFTQVHNTL